MVEVIGDFDHKAGMNETWIRQAPFVLLDDSQPAQRAGVSYLFHSPDKIIMADTPDQVPAALAAIDQAAADGLYIAGYLAYEAAAGLEDKLSHIATRPLDLNAAPKSEETSAPQSPLLWMMVTKHRETLLQEDVDTLVKISEQGSKRAFDLTVGDPPLSKADYCRTIDTIKDHILSGDVYQINYTFPLPVRLSGDALALYAALRVRQPVPYSAFIDTGSQKILSLSPELFVSVDGDQIQAQPMKGTTARGRFNEEDTEYQNFLKSDPKSQAENLMIVDLIRNDLSRMAKTGTVKVDHLFDTKIFKSVIQMTSDVTAAVEADLSPSMLLKALFPCGSVTGAPKIRAMEIIHMLETAPRGVYCGAIGHFSPAQDTKARQWMLNVPIRTLKIDQGGTGYFSLGSGIVADSDAGSEYEECLLKGRFLTGLGDNAVCHPPFGLFETMRAERIDKKWQITDLTAHIQRLTQSAAYFDMPFQPQLTEDLIKEHLSACNADTARHSCHHPFRRVKAMLGQQGQITVTSAALLDTQATATTPTPVLKVALCAQRQQSDNPLLFHKTTHRRDYDLGHQKATTHGYADLIYLNERAELTEGCISTLFIQQKPEDPQLLTPALRCGLLPGILRQHYLKTGKAKEAVLTLDDMRTAHKIYIGNRLRGLRRVELDEIWL